MTSSKDTRGFTSNLGAIVAAAGSAIGLGNIWRFPYTVGQNGGGAFLLLYMLFVFFLGLPIMMSEFVIGRRSQRNTVGAFRQLGPQYRRWTFVGVLGIVAASFSSADSALTSLTTIWCVDICRRPDDERLRKSAHLAMCVLFVLFILLFRMAGSTSLIDAIYTIVGYTYGPLLGLFAFGLLTRRAVNDRMVPYVAVASPFLCWVIDTVAGQLAGYSFGYELLLLNGVLTFSGLYLLARPAGG